MLERKELPSTLAGQALTGGEPAIDYKPVALMPSVKVMKIGGQSIMDRGRPAVFPILDELVSVKDKYQMLLCMGGGTRARHLYSVAADLEMPTGVLAALGGYVPRQNARMVQMLLSSHGGVFILHD